jgi:hypothetical protein
LNYWAFKGNGCLKVPSLQPAAPICFILNALHTLTPPAETHRTVQPDSPDWADLRHDEEGGWLAVQCLDRRLQRRPVMLPEYRFGDDDPPVRIDAQQISIVSGVVQDREADAVGDIRLSALVAVRDDVGGLQQFRDGQAPKPNSAGRRRTAPVRGIRPDADGFLPRWCCSGVRWVTLARALSGGCANSYWPAVSRTCGALGQLKLAADRDGTEEVAWIPFHQIAGVENLIDARHQRVEIDQG